MPPLSYESTSVAPTNVSSESSTKSTRLESLAYYIFLATVALAPLAFLPTPYISLDAVKTVLIGVGVMISAILYGVLAYKERKLVLPPRSILWTGILVIVSVVASSLLSMHAGKSFFGQGIEINTANFILSLFLAGLVAFSVAYRKSERALVLYVAMTASFILLALFHILRFVFGASFLPLGILSGSLTSTILGSWYDLATYAVVVLMIVFSALSILPLSRKMKIVYWVVLVVSFLMAFVINSGNVWIAAMLAFLVLSVSLSIARPRPAGGMVASVLKRISWFPVVLFLIAALMSFKGISIAGPVITKLHAEYTTLSLPWPVTLDITSGALKAKPLFGVGPNHFDQAYLAFKPVGINSTYAWSTEFNYAFGLLATFVATQGVLGVIAWGLLLIFLGILVVRSLRRLPDDAHERFATVSSVGITVFLWIMASISVPSHTMLFFAFTATALTAALAVKHGLFAATTVSPRVGTGVRKLFNLVMIVLVVIGAVWGVVFAKNAIALAYFGSGIKLLNVTGDPKAADAAFAKAESLNTTDVYLQARAEAGIAQARKIISSIDKNAPASSTQALVTEVGSIVNSAVKYSQSAVAYDPTNYYNYVSEARVSELAAGLKMDKAFDNAVNSYTSAIRLNPLNPTLYVSLAQVQISGNKLDDAVKTLGAALQVKNDYLDAVYLLSQIFAAQGNIRDAITAANVAVQINPQSPFLLFQLGILLYNGKDFENAAKALARAVELQPDYANAQYFLGLSYSKIGNVEGAISQFEKLAAANPDNQEVPFILNNLRAGRSPFADAQPPVTPTPEKRSSLPIKEKKR